jgi:hypothetical protein
VQYQGRLSDDPVFDTGATCPPNRYGVGVSLRHTRPMFQQEGKPVYRRNAILMRVK